MEYNKPMINLDKVNKQVLYKLELLPEEEEPQGFNYNDLKRIKKHIASGKLIHFTARVVAYIPGIIMEGEDFLGDCIYESEEQFELNGYYQDMKTEALSDLMSNVNMYITRTHNKQFKHDPAKKGLFIHKHCFGGYGISTPLGENIFVNQILCNALMRIEGKTFMQCLKKLKDKIKNTPFENLKIYLSEVIEGNFLVQQVEG